MRLSPPPLTCFRRSTETAPLPISTSGCFEEASSTLAEDGSRASSVFSLSPTNSVGSSISEKAGDYGGSQQTSVSSIQDRIKKMQMAGGVPMPGVARGPPPAAGKRPTPAAVGTTGAMATGSAGAAPVGLPGMGGLPPGGLAALKARAAAREAEEAAESGASKQTKPPAGGDLVHESLGRAAIAHKRRPKQGSRPAF